MQHEGGAKQAGFLPKLEDMKSAENTPPATPRHEAKRTLSALNEASKKVDNDSTADGTSKQA